LRTGSGRSRSSRRRRHRHCASLPSRTAWRSTRDVTDVDTRALKACVVALKPQILKLEASKLAGIAQSGALMLSIAAGTQHARVCIKPGDAKARIVRAMPNTPGAIGRGISALLCGQERKASADRKFVQKLLAALGETRVGRSRRPDRHRDGRVGLGTGLCISADGGAGSGSRSRGHAARSGRETRARDGCRVPAHCSMPIRANLQQLRRDVTSPHGTTEAALEILMSDNGLVQIVSPRRGRGPRPRYRYRLARLSYLRAHAHDRAMIFRHRPPPPPLAEFVAMLWYCEGIVPAHRRDTIVASGDMASVWSISRADELVWYTGENYATRNTLKGIGLGGVRIPGTLRSMQHNPRSWASSSSRAAPILSLALRRGSLPTAMCRWMISGAPTPVGYISVWSRHPTRIQKF
jgi:pyrroline-5-carboxylate reductase